MTLEEAYKRNKAELDATKRELEKYRKASFPLSEKEDLEKEIRKWSRSYAALEKQFQGLVHDRQSFQKEKEDLRHDLEQERIRRIELERQNGRLVLELKILRAEWDELKGENLKLTVQQNKDSTNSSLPSSLCPFGRKKVHNNRKPSGKKPGAQPGHKGHERKAPENAEFTTVLLPAPECTSDPDYYKTGNEIHKKLVDISLTVHVTDYCAEEFRRHSDGTRVHAPFPKGICNEMNYGAGVKATAFFLNNYCNVPILKTAEFLSSLTDGEIHLSTRLISNLVKQFSAKTESERLEIFRQLQEAQVIYADATVGNVNGKQKAVYINTDKDCALYQASGSKGLKGIEGTPVEKNRGILVHDHDKSFYHHGIGHQECLAHILRYLMGSVEFEPHLTWNRKMKGHLEEMIRFAKNHPERRKPEDDKVRAFRKKYHEILMLARTEYKENPPSEGYRDGYNLYRRMLEYTDSHLRFLSDPNVDWTNNISERGLRKFKRKQKQAVAFRSMSGVTGYCHALTIIETARLRKQNPYTVVKAAFQKGTKIEA